MNVYLSWKKEFKCYTQQLCFHLIISPTNWQERMGKNVTAGIFYKIFMLSQAQSSRKHKKQTTTTVQNGR